MVSISLIVQQYLIYCNLTTFDMGCTSFKILYRYVTPNHVPVSLNFRAENLKQANGEDSNLTFFRERKLRRERKRKVFRGTFKLRPNYLRLRLSGSIFLKI